jgi:hypothetical protein
MWFVVVLATKFLPVEWGDATNSFLPSSSRQKTDLDSFCFFFIWC